MQLPADYDFKEELYRSYRSVVWRVDYQQRSYIAKAQPADNITIEGAARLHHEYAILSQLNHHGVIGAISLLGSDDNPVLILEDLNRISLEDWQSGSVDLEGFLDLAIQLTEIVTYVHSQRIIHKNINPTNILIRPGSKRLSLSDFSIAAVLPRESQSLPKPSSIEGNLKYIAPEQTGRISHSLDQRTDLYALGVVFYKLLTGRIPFTSDDALELIHAHIAKTPEAPNAYINSIPDIVSELVLTLLRKEPAERYQSGDGLLHDLNQCLERWKSQRKIDSFPLRLKDFSRIFQIKDKLYGRKSELVILKDALERACADNFEVICISGDNGSGKTALVKEIQRSVQSRLGSTITVQFNSNLSGRPFAAISKGLSNFCSYLLGLDQTTLGYWKARILEHIGTSGKQLTDLIPNLGYIIGLQQDVQLPGSIERLNRLNFAICRFLQAVATKEHPVALVLENIEWADDSSGQVIQSLISNDLAKHFLLIATYSKNRNSDEHSRRITDKALNANKIINISLENLRPEDVNDMLMDIFGNEGPSTDRLANIIYRKTQGNPLLTNEFLKTIYSKGYIRYRDAGSDEPQESIWLFDIDAIEKLAIPDQVIDIIIEKIRWLPQQTQLLLGIASCFGSMFSLEGVAYVAEKTRANVLIKNSISRIEVSEQITICVDEGYIVRESSHKEGQGYRFSHDSIRAASDSLLDLQSRADIHETIVELIKQQDSGENGSVFRMLDHLDFVFQTRPQRVDALSYMKLLLQAGHSSREAASFNTAKGYLKKAVSLFTEDLWAGDYTLAFELHKELYHSLFLTYELEESKVVFTTLVDHVNDREDKINIYLLLLENLGAQGDYVGIADTSIMLLNMLGVEVPSDEEQIKRENKRFARQLEGINFNSFAEAPESKDPKFKLIIQLATQLGFSLYVLNKLEFAQWTTYKRLLMTIEQGVCEHSPAACVSYGMYNCLKKMDYVKAIQYAEMGIRLWEKYDNPFFLGRNLIIYGSQFMPWRYHYRETYENIRNGIALCYDMGDLIYGSIGAIYLLNMQLAQGTELTAIKREMLVKKYFVDHTSTHMQRIRYQMFYQNLEQLLGNTYPPNSLSSETINEEEFIEHVRTYAVTAALYYFIKIRMHYFSGDYKCGFSLLDKMSAMEEVLLGSTSMPEAYFYMALCTTRIYHKLEEAQRKDADIFLERTRDHFLIWSDNCSDNFYHKHLLIEAECYRIQGDIKNAIIRYQQALSSAAENGFINCLGVISEVYGNFWYNLGEFTSAKHHLQNAVANYEKWGARYLIDTLMEQYPSMLAKGRDPAIYPHYMSESATQLDIKTILKASQAISSEIQLENLIQRLANICLETTGAERACLFLERNDELYLEVECNVDGDVRFLMESLRLETCNTVPKSVLYYTARSHNEVIIEGDVASNEFYRDSYFGQHPVKFSLSVPLIYQTKLVGILYLENSLSSNHYGQERKAVLEVLISQSAISIENAKLYQELHAMADGLEKEVNKRTEEIKNAKEVAEHATRSKSEFLATMSHEIRTPMNGVLGMTQLLQNTSLDQDQQEIVRTIQNSADSLLVIINDILDFSKIEAGKMELHQVAFSLYDSLNEVGEMMGAVAQQKGLELIIDVDSSIPEYWIGDQVRLRQIIINFVNNAIKFTYKGYVILKVQQRGDRLHFAVTDTGIGIPPDRMEKLFKAFSQIDASTTRASGGTGLGLVIAKSLAEAMNGQVGVESQENVGSTFWFTARLPEAPQRVYSMDAQLRKVSTLYVDSNDVSRPIVHARLAVYFDAITCYRSLTELPGVVKDSLIFVTYPFPDSELLILEKLHRHNHFVLISTFPAFSAATQLRNKYSLNVITRPVTAVGIRHLIAKFSQPADEQKALEESGSTSVAKPLYYEAKILLAEDNEVNQRVAKGILNNIGYDIAIVSNGKAALEAYDTNDWDLILMDCQMPEMDGFEATKQIRRRERNKGRHIPIIALTANAMQGDEQTCINAGMDDYLAKPIQKEQLAQMLEYHLRLSFQDSRPHV